VVADLNDAETNVGSTMNDDWTWTRDKRWTAAVCIR